MSYLYIIFLINVFAQLRSEVPAFVSFSSKVAKIVVVIPGLGGRTHCKHDVANRVNRSTAQCTLTVHLCNGKSISLICSILFFTSILSRSIEQHRVLLLVSVT